MKAKAFTLEGVDAVFAGMDDGARWNGFCCPLFTKEQGDFFVQEWRKTSHTIEDPQVSWSETENAFVIQHGNENYLPMSTEVVKEEVIDGVSYYRIGGYGWCWFEDESAEDQD